MTVEIALVGLIAVIIIVQRWKEQDVLEQLRAERLEVRRDEQARCKQQFDNAFQLYQAAIREGFDVADTTNDRLGRTKNEDAS